MNPVTDMKFNESLMSILLVEDDEVDIMNLKRAFKKSGISNPLHVARNGVEALDILRGPNVVTPAPRIVLLDINMPKMNGIELLTEIRKDEELQSLLVFVLTTSNQDRDKFSAYQQNVAGYIVKPIDFQEFLKAVSTLTAYWNLIEFSE